MYNKSELKIAFEQRLNSSGIIAILRGITTEEVPGVCQALADGGITMLEVPLNTPNAFECIRTACQNALPGQMVGAGTVLTAEDVKRVKAVGGEFIIAPNCDAEVIRETVAQELLSIPGCFTATECLAAQKAGADYIKLFPAGSLGATYIKDLQAVVKLPFLAVGGVKTENIASFKSCCIGAGIGSAIYKPGKAASAIQHDAKTMFDLWNC